MERESKEKQTSLPLAELVKPKPKKKAKPKAPASPPAPKAPAKKSAKSAATPLMRKVAEKSYNPKIAAKVFTPEEIEDIQNRRIKHLPVSREEQETIKELYRKIKSQVREMEKTNQQRVIIFPSLTNGAGWYKAIEFSALYYAYRLADRMGRRARVLKDSDHFSKAQFTVSIANIENFIEQFKRLEDPELEITENGVYIFTLKKPLSDDEVGRLRMTEETRREKMHNVLRPREMDPATFNAIMMIDRQLIPRIKKLQPPYFHSIGCRIVNDICDLMSIYNQFADGFGDRKETGQKLLATANDLIAGLTLLAEIRVWPYDVAASIGENANQVKRRIITDFNLQVGKEKNG